MRYFKFVGTKKEANEYSKTRPKVGVVYPETAKFGASDLSPKFFYDGGYRDCSIKSEWQEVFVYEKKKELVVPQKTFPSDAEVLDSYQIGVWHCVKKLLPSDEVPLNVEVEHEDNSKSFVFWDNILGGFRGWNGVPLDDVIFWRG